MLSESGRRNVSARYIPTRTFQTSERFETMMKEDIIIEDILGEEGRKGKGRDGMIKRKLGLECGLRKITKQRYFEVRFFGSRELIEPDMSGVRQTVSEITGDIIVKGKERSLPKMIVQILPDGLHVTEKHKKESEKIIPIRKLSYGTFSSSDIELLVFNHHISKSPVRMECFVVWCEAEARAREIGLALYGAVRELHFQSVREKRGGAAARAELHLHTEEQTDHRSSEEQAITPPITPPNKAPAATSNVEVPEIGHELLTHNEDNYLSLPHMCDTHETELRTALEDMLKVVEEEELKGEVLNDKQHIP